LSSGVFIAFEGPDGVGKTTLAATIAEQRYDDVVVAGHISAASDDAIVFVSRRQPSLTSPFAKRLMDHLSMMLWHCGDERDLSDSFWLAAQVAWFTAHTETVIGPLLAEGHTVLVDGWIYKFQAKLLLQGHSQSTLDTMFRSVREPDAVILLEGDAGHLYDRKAEFRDRELGMHAGYAQLNRETFVEYQTKAASNLRRYADRPSWHVFEVGIDEGPAATAARLAPLVADCARASASDALA